MLNKHMLILLCAFGSSWVLPGCGDASFGDGVPVAAAPTKAPTTQPFRNDNDAQDPIVVPRPTIAQTPQPPGGPFFLDTTENVVTDFEKPLVDVVWLIDNSSSMTEEAAHVRQNFQAFLDQTNSQTDMRLMLISEKYAAAPNWNCVIYGSEGTPCGVSLPPALAAPNYFHFPTFVASTNPLAFAAAASCIKNIGNDPANYKICGSNAFHGSIEEIYSLSNTAGVLANLFRPEAERAYVIVTDDNAYGIDETNFLDFVGTSTTKAPYVFAFRGLEQNSGGSHCAITAHGHAYDVLAERTGGAVYDICETDWSNNFKDLSSRIAKLKETELPLKHKNIIAVQAVRLDGELVDPSKYVLEGNILKIAAGLVQAKGQKLQVQYSYFTSH